MSGIFQNTQVHSYIFIMEQLVMLLADMYFLYPVKSHVLSHALSHVMNHVLSHVVSQSKSHVKSHSCKSYS